jgi:hypothetical protein
MGDTLDVIMAAYDDERALHQHAQVHTIGHGAAG